MRFLLCAIFFGTALNAEGITIPLDGGTILIRPNFNSGQKGSLAVEVPFELTNHTSSWWKNIKVQFEIGGLCYGEPRQWSPAPVRVGPVGYSKSSQADSERGNFFVLLSQADLADGCTLEIIDATLVLAEKETSSIKGPGERVDLEHRLRAVKVQRDAEAAEQAKKLAAEQQRQRALAAERKRKQAEEDSKSTAEQAKIRATCSAIYDRTINKKVVDLTVKETQDVQACMALGLYPPH